VYVVDKVVVLKDVSFMKGTILCYLVEVPSKI